MKKIFSKLHLWLSVPFGIFISIVCLTGALLVFEEEINEMNHPELYRVEKSEGNTMSPKALAAIVAKTLPEDTQVTGITISDDPTKTWKVSISKPHHASVAVNPYTGEVMGQISRSEFFNQVMALHRYLLVKPEQRGDMTVGKWIVGASVLAMAFILITGLVVWFPRKGQSWGSRFAISVKGGSRKFWYQLHNNGGMYVCIFLLIMALTGLTWSFKWYRTGFYAMFGGEGQRTEMRGQGNGKPEFKHGEGEGRPEGRPEGREGRPEGKPEGRPEDRGGRPEGRPEGREERPEGRPEGKPEFKHEGDSASNHGEYKHERREGHPEGKPEFKHEGDSASNHSEYKHEGREGRPEGKPEFKHEGDSASNHSEYKHEGREGRPEGKPEFNHESRPEDKPEFKHEGEADFSSLTVKHDNEPTKGMQAWVYQLHTGKWGGLFSKVLYFLACLIGATLPWTGYYFWLKKKSRQKSE
jgi:uncharacterized iron-regulated membrane protein